MFLFPGQGFSLVQTDHQLIEKISKLRSGKNFDGLSVKSARVKPGQTLSLLLRPYNVSSAVIHETAIRSKKIFDVRRIRTGHTYSVIFDTALDNQVLYFVYDKTPETFVLYDLSSPVKIYTGKNQVQLKEKVVIGTIQYSLWGSLQTQDHTTELIMKLADVFSGSIDFNRMQKNDSFQILYEEKYVNDKSIGIKGIKAATITTNGMQQEAFYFEHHGKKAFYDAKGNNLEKTFLKTPLKYTRLTSTYRPKRLHPIKKDYRPHPGIDYAAPIGTPVKSVSDGVVSFIGRSPSAGKYIKIRHSHNQVSEYLHLSAFEKSLRVKKRVKKGEVIGYVGRTGWATGPHLDFRFAKNGRYVNYTKLVFPSGDPLDEACKTSFFENVARFNSYIELARMAKSQAENVKTLSASELTPKKDARL